MNSIKNLTIYNNEIKLIFKNAGYEINDKLNTISWKYPLPASSISFIKIVHVSLIFEKKSNSHIEIPSVLSMYEKTINNENKIYKEFIYKFTNFINEEIQNASIKGKCLYEFIICDDYKHEFIMIMSRIELQQKL